MPHTPVGANKLLYYTPTLSRDFCKYSRNYVITIFVEIIFLIMDLTLLEDWVKLKTIKASDQNSSRLVLRNEFTKIRVTSSLAVNSFRQRGSWLIKYNLSQILFEWCKLYRNKRFSKVCKTANLCTKNSLVQFHLESMEHVPTAETFQQKNTSATQFEEI